MNTYHETLAYLYRRLPMFTRSGPAAYKEGLGNIIAFCAYLQHPENKYRTIHIAGTNGKGSTSHMLAAILQCAGYRTGLYTSPHLKDFTERVRINGVAMDEEFVVDFVKQHQTFIEEMSASFFEVTTAMAFDYFAQQEVDVAVIETGLGGRLDSTNIITPDLSLITNISWDHADLLGDSLEKIAREKAGIIKPKTPVVISERQAGIAEVFNHKATAEEAPLYFATDYYKPIHSESNLHITKHVFLHKLQELIIQTDLNGAYQANNIAGVLCACDVLNEYGYLISEAHIQDALTKICSLTGLRGRWDVLQENPIVIADVAHNEGGLKYTLEQFIQLRKPMHFVIGFVKDKDIRKILPLFPKDARYYFCMPALPRALSAETLKQQAALYGLIGEDYPTVKAALDAAKHEASASDAIYVGGSTFVVAEVI
jgi:dihydrofolate synthase/folylpolyglutamate synthase